MIFGEKDILHLSGGLNNDEPAEFARYLREFGETAESFYLGGKVSAIAKKQYRT